MKNNFKLTVTVLILAGAFFVCWYFFKYQKNLMREKVLLSDIQRIVQSIEVSLSEPAKCAKVLGGINRNFNRATIESVDGKYFIESSTLTDALGYGESQVKINTFEIRRFEVGLLSSEKFQENH